MTTMDSETHARMIVEHAELRTRIARLERFISESEAFGGLPDVDRADLVEQLEHMRGYCTVLSRRVNRHDVHA